MTHICASLLLYVQESLCFILQFLYSWMGLDSNAAQLKDNSFFRLAVISSCQNLQGNTGSSMSLAAWNRLRLGARVHLSLFSSPSIISSSAVSKGSASPGTGKPSSMSMSMSTSMPGNESGFATGSIGKTVERGLFTGEGESRSITAWMGCRFKLRKTWFTCSCFTLLCISACGNKRGTSCLSTGPAPNKEAPRMVMVRGISSPESNLRSNSCDQTESAWKLEGRLWAAGSFLYSLKMGFWASIKRSLDWFSGHALKGTSSVDVPARRQYTPCSVNTIKWKEGAMRSKKSL